MQGKMKYMNVQRQQQQMYSFAVCSFYTFARHLVVCVCNFICWPLCMVYIHVYMYIYWILIMYIFIWWFCSIVISVFVFMLVVLTFVPKICHLVSLSWSFRQLRTNWTKTVVQRSGEGEEKEKWGKIQASDGNTINTSYFSFRFFFIECPFISLWSIWKTI